MSTLFDEPPQAWGPVHCAVAKYCILFPITPSPLLERGVVFISEGFTPDEWRHYVLTTLSTMFNLHGADVWITIRKTQT